MTIFAIETAQAHIEDLHREAAQRHLVATARRAAAENGTEPASRGHRFPHVRQLLVSVVHAR